MALTPSQRVSLWRKNNLEKAREIDRRYRAKYKEKYGFLPSTKSVRKARQLNPAKLLLKSAKNRAKQKGIPFNITEEDIPIPEFCPILKVKIELEPFRHRHGPSIDRKIPSLGYVKGNVAVISMRANLMKRNYTLDFFEAVVAYLRSE
jgi:hypothetical protein